MERQEHFSGRSRGWRSLLPASTTVAGPRGPSRALAGSFDPGPNRGARAAAVDHDHDHDHDRGGDAGGDAKRRSGWALRGMPSLGQIASYLLNPTYRDTSLVVTDAGIQVEVQPGHLSGLVKVFHLDGEATGWDRSEDEAQRALAALRLPAGRDQDGVQNQTLPLTAGMRPRDIALALTRLYDGASVHAAGVRLEARGPSLWVWERVPVRPVRFETPEPTGGGWVLTP